MEIHEYNIYDIYFRVVILPSLPAEAFRRLRSIENIDIVPVHVLVQILLEMNLYQCGSTRNYIIEQCRNIIQNDNLFERLSFDALVCFEQTITYTEDVIRELLNYKESLNINDLRVLCDRLIDVLRIYISRIEMRMSLV
jgi:hypothetical protein